MDVILRPASHWLGHAYSCTYLTNFSKLAETQNCLLYSIAEIHHYWIVNCCRIVVTLTTHFCKMLLFKVVLLISILPVVL